MKKVIVYLSVDFDGGVHLSCLKQDENCIDLLIRDWLCLIDRYDGRDLIKVDLDNKVVSFKVENINVYEYHSFIRWINFSNEDILEVNYV